MRIIYMGTPDFAVEPLEQIVQAGHQVCAVVTQPDKQRGRGREVSFSPVKAWALEQGIPVLQPVRIKAAEAVAQLREYQADIYVVAAFGQILSQEILDLPPFGCICIHGSLLPAYRGAAPIQRAVINGEEESGITIMQMDRGIDTGAMLLKAALPITPTETGDSLQHKLSSLGARLVVEALRQLEAGTLTGEKQQEEAASYAPMLRKEEGEIAWQDSAVRIERLVRGLNSWPSAYTFYQGKGLKIWEAAAEPLAAGAVQSAADGRQSAAGAAGSLQSAADAGQSAGAADALQPTAGAVQSVDQVPGTVVEVTKDALVIAAGEGGLRIKELQLEGKKRLPVKEFLLGCRIMPGEKLGS